MADIQYATAEIGRGKKKIERRKKIEETAWQKYNVRMCYAGRPSYCSTVTEMKYAAWM